MVHSALRAVREPFFCVLFGSEGGDTLSVATWFGGTIHRFNVLPVLIHDYVFAHVDVILVDRASPWHSPSLGLELTLPGLLLLLCWICIDCVVVVLLCCCAETMVCPTFPPCPVFASVICYAFISVSFVVTPGFWLSLQGSPRRPGPRVGTGLEEHTGRD